MALGLWQHLMPFLVNDRYSALLADNMYSVRFAELMKGVGTEREVLLSSYYEPRMPCFIFVRTNEK